MKGLVMPDYYDTSIKPFGTSSNAPTVDVAPIKIFGCTVIDFNVSADWSSQGGSLTCRLIESETDGDRLVIPVLGSPVLFEMKRRNDGRVLFHYIGIVDSFSRSANTDTKTYTATLSSPLKILDSTKVILDRYTGLGSSVEGVVDFTGILPYDFGHNNSLINISNRRAGVYHWWNVSNLINVFGILENDDVLYRVPTHIPATGFDPFAPRYSDFGFSGRNKDGITLVKLMWALHVGINHTPPIDELDPFTGFVQRQQSHGGNLLFGRHNYNVHADKEAVPYYYHFDAIHFYNQVVNKLGPEYRVEGEYKSITEIISSICQEANLEFFSYIDIYNPFSLDVNGNIIGSGTLQDFDPAWQQAARFNWPAGDQYSKQMIPLKFTEPGVNGSYGGTIRIQTIDKNAFFNAYRPFSNIAYNLIGLEVPDLRDYNLVTGGPLWGGNHKSGIHPGRRPYNETFFGLDGNDFPYSDPLDSSGVGNPDWGFMNNENIAKVGTMSMASGGSFPVDATGINGAPVLFDEQKMLDYLKIKNSDISIKLNDFTTMKVITGGYQTRIISTPREMLRHYWGDIVISSTGFDPRMVQDVETDALGLDENSSRKIPVVTQLLDPRDIDDYILIDMKSEFGTADITGVLHQGVYAASLFEVRCAMSSFESWKSFVETYKYSKVKNIVDTFYTQTVDTPASGIAGVKKSDLEQSTGRNNSRGGLGYVAVSDLLGLGNTFALHKTPNELVSETVKPSGNSIAPPGSGSGLFGLGVNITRAAAELTVKEAILPAIHQKVKEIGDTHYGKSWYAPVPYCKTIQDLDGDNLVGNFKRAWELTDSAYAEPSTYYERRIPQSNMFISDGKVLPFVNYDQNFISSETGQYDANYVQEITNLMGRKENICNFSEYSLDELCITRYSYSGGVGVNSRGEPYTIYGVSGHDIVHAAPQSVSDGYAFLPFAYDVYYNRSILPYSDVISGVKKKYTEFKSDFGLAPLFQGALGAKNYRVQDPPVSNKPGITKKASPKCPGEDPGQLSDALGYFNYDVIAGIPAITHTGWFPIVVSGLQSLDYGDNANFCYPFVKFTTSRVFLPVPAPGEGGELFATDGYNVFLDAKVKYDNGLGCLAGDKMPNAKKQKRQHLITEDSLLSVLNPFQACVVPKSFNYPQVSTRYVYGPWMTSTQYIPFRGKIEYEQDDSLVPENYLIPTNFGKFGSYQLKQTSGFVGMNLAAQGRANAIDDFSLFAVEEGSITIPGTPNILRIGDSLYGIQQVTDVKINVSNDRIETTYGFKTISPKFGKNNRDLEKKLTKISNDIKKLKLR